MKVGSIFIFRDGKKYRCVFQKLNKRVSKQLCRNCKKISNVNPETDLDSRICPECGKSYWEGYQNYAKI
jgi:uncharacterized protein with PIN domain